MIPMVARLLVLCSVALLACGAPEDASPAGEDATCSVELSVPDQLAAPAERAAERLLAATGCVLTLADTGLPVEFAPGATLDGDGKPVCGATPVSMIDHHVTRVRGISVDWTLAGCPAAEALILHESMHALVNSKGDILDLGHAASGVFGRYPAMRSTNPPLDAATLEFFCGRANCSVLAPER